MSDPSRRPALTGAMPLCACLLAVSMAPASAASAPQTLPTVQVVGSATMRVEVPGVVVRKGHEQLAHQNIADSADVLRYFPNLQVRQRYIGDANAILSGRNAGTLQSARSLVYADGLLLSNFMTNGWNGAPRWGIVSPQQIDAVEVLYGPYSALYPGNSIGNTVLIHLRLPDRFTTSASAAYFSQDYGDDYGATGRYDGHRLGALLGDRNGRWRWLLAVNRLENHGQPMEYATARVGGDPDRAVVVTGATLDRNPDGSRRLVYGARNLQHTRQTQATLQVGAQLGGQVEARFTLGGWHDRSSSTDHSFLRDTSGQPVYLGTVRVDDNIWTLPDGGLAPATADRTHVLFGAQLEGCFDNHWCWKAIASRYDFQRDVDRDAATSAAADGQGGAGTVADMGGSGWDTFDLRVSGPLGDHHTLYAGVHYDRYRLDSRVHASANWRSGTPGALVSAYGGRTSTRALYLQDIWDFAPSWTLTLGLRWEQWRAYGGVLANAEARVAYPARQRSDISPKASVSWRFGAPWELRLSFGKAVRYPTVEELFQGALSHHTIVNNNPDLAPERDWSTDLSLVRQLHEATGGCRCSRTASPTPCTGKPTSRGRCP